MISMLKIASVTSGKGGHTCTCTVADSKTTLCMQSSHSLTLSAYYNNIGPRAQLLRFTLARFTLITIYTPEITLTIILPSQILKELTSDRNRSTSCCFEITLCYYYLYVFYLLLLVRTMKLINV